jgi:phosphoglycolate phosphatase
MEASSFSADAIIMQQIGTKSMARWMLLDLDGTLVDSVPDLAAALNRSLAAHGLAPLSRPLVQGFVGDGAKALVDRGFAHYRRVADAAVLQTFLDDYGANAAVETRPYPGVPEGLARLRDAGWTLAVCTNKPEGPARSLLAALGLAGHFAVVGGGDSFPARKPDPAHLLATLAAAGGTVDRCVMVGDHHNDILAAVGAGVPAVWARWGYGVGVEGAVAAIDAFAALPGVANEVVPG